MSAGQHGLIDRDALERIGVPAGQVARWVADGRLERCAPRVWRLVGSPITWEQRLRAGLLSLGPSAAVSHRAATCLHRFDRAPVDAVEFLVPRQIKRSSLAETVHRTTRIGRADVVRVRGFRTTSATRTIVDLANTGIEPDSLKAAIESAVRMGLSAPIAISRHLTTLGRRGRGGVRLLDGLLLDAGGHTMLEREFLTLVREAGLPRPRTQGVIRDDRRRVARVDFVYEQWDIVVEVSGRLGHSSPTERANDAQRRNELQALGFKVYEFTWEHVIRRREWVQAQMRAIVDACP